MKIIKYIALTMLAIVIILGVAGLFLPSAQHVERQIQIAAPPSKIYAYINDLHNFNKWSPWAKIDPNTSYVYSGPDQGVGAKVEWSSEHKHVGAGSQEIIESVENSFVKTKLEFGPGDPAEASFTLAQNRSDTTVTWAFDTYASGTVERYFGLMLEKWLGPSYEEGLANLKTLVESN